jgi:hypothetical protein
VYSAARMLELGWIVLKPYGDNQRYDMVVDRGKGFEKVQVKSTSLKNGCIIASTHSIYNTTKISKSVQYTIDDIDTFCIYCRDTKDVYIVPARDYLEEDNKTIRKSIKLRVDPTKNNQQKNVKWANAYKVGSNPTFSS